MNDLKFAFRQLLKNQGFTAVAVLTLALSIGATTIVFSIVNAVLLQPLPFTDSERLVWLYHNKPKRELLQFPVGAYKFKFWKEHSQCFEQLVMAGPMDFFLASASETELIRGLKVTANFCDLLGVQPFLGRAFRPEENEPGAPKVAMLSYRLWQKRFAGDPAVLGKTIRQHDQSYTIVGVLPPTLRFPIGPMPAWRVLSTGDPDIWLPVNLNDDVGFVLGRVKPEISQEQAQAEMHRVTDRHEQLHPNTEGWKVDVVSMRDQASGHVRFALLLILGR